MGKCEICTKDVPDKKLRQIDSGQTLCTFCLAELQRTAQTERIIRVRPDASGEQVRPWIRYLARTLDIIIWETVVI